MLCRKPRPLRIVLPAAVQAYECQVLGKISISGRSQTG